MHVMEFMANENKISMHITVVVDDEKVLGKLPVMIMS